ncbi:ABC transporter substrate-binding protein [Streptomyces boninensis]|uniref:ABC transporter substrate-binding protein n=1 Tax=Streptomyces boninensis TaxID=2039455 RepID=UPI003B219880
MSGATAMPVARTVARSRRGFLAAGGALGLGALLAACGDDDGGTGTAAGKGGGAWSFKDDRGKTAKSDATPKRIVAYVGAAAALHDLGIECDAIFGPTKGKNGKPEMQAGRLDVDKLTNLGNTYGQFNVEKYAALEPDLLVSSMMVPPEVWYLPPDSAKKILSLAPSVAIQTGKTTLVKSIQRYAALAESLGADPKAKKVTDAKARFEAASESLRKAAKSNRGVRILAISASPDLLYAGFAPDFYDLRHFADLGVQFVTPGKRDKGGFWESTSWENADRYDADLILVDQRTGNLQPDQLEKSKPTWRDLPAVKAGQVIPWMNEAPPSHAAYAPLIENLAKSLQEAKKVRA